MSSLTPLLKLFGHRKGPPLSVFDRLCWTLDLNGCQFVKYPKRGVTFHREERRRPERRERGQCHHYLSERKRVWQQLVYAMLDLHKLV